MTGWPFRMRRVGPNRASDIGPLSKGHLMPDLYTAPDEDRTPFKGPTEGHARPRAGECNDSSVRLYGNHTAILPGNALTTTNSPDRGAPFANCLRQYAVGQGVKRSPAGLRPLIPGRATAALVGPGPDLSVHP